MFVWVKDQTERDLVILRHDIGIRWQDGRREERGINFVVYGATANTDGHSAMVCFLLKIFKIKY